MKCHQKLTVIALLLSGIGAHATTVLIDFGADTNETTAAGNTWNNISHTRLSGGAGLLSAGPDGFGTLALLDSTGTSSGINLVATVEELHDLQVGGGAVDYTGAMPLSPTGTTIPLSASGDSIFSGKTGSSAGRYVLTLSGLDDSKAYDFTFFSGYNGGADNDNALFTVEGATTATAQTSFTAQTNQAEFLQISGISPSGGSIIVKGEGIIDLNSGGTQSNMRWNTLEITVIPEPAGGVLIASAGIMSLLRRRRS